MDERNPIYREEEIVWMMAGLMYLKM
jgi:hypothetical protein